MPTKYEIHLQREQERSKHKATIESLTNRLEIARDTLAVIPGHCEEEKRIVRAEIAQINGFITDEGKALKLLDEVSENEAAAVVDKIG